MSKKTLVSLFLGLGFVAGAAFGGEGSGAGGGYCDYQKATCTNDDKSVVACPNDKNLYVGLNGNSHFYPVHFVPAPQHVVGAGLLWQGDSASIHIQTDTAPSPEGTYSTLNVEELGLVNVALRCKLHNH